MTTNKMEPPTDLIVGNYFDKYRSRNPIHQALVSGFVKAARDLVGLTRAVRVLEVGCGPGDLAAALFWDAGQPTVYYTGVDISSSVLEVARLRCPGGDFLPASADALPFTQNQFDLVVMCEVLEHLKSPAECLAEACRVSSKWVLVSVPWEPVWRILNMLRGKYLLRFGNTPGHIQHFSRRRIRSLVDHHLTRVEGRCPFPWTMILASTEQDSTSGTSEKSLDRSETVLPEKPMR